MALMNTKTLIFFLLFVHAASWGNTTTDSLEIVSLKAINTEQELQISKLSTQIQSLENELQTITELAQSIKAPSSLLWKMGIATIAGVLLALCLWRLFIWLEPRWYTKLIQKLVERYEEISVLKRNKSIVLLMPEIHAPEKDNTTFIRTFFSTKEFERVTYLDAVNNYIPVKEPVDLFFANNETGYFTQDILEDFLMHHPNAFLFYFGAPGSWDFKRSLELNKRINLANSRSQIYGNLLSTLKLQDLTTPKISH